MNISKTSFYIPLLTILIGLLTVMGCDSQEFISASENESLSLNSKAPFPVPNQGFNIDLRPWVDRNVAGIGGWCGNIALTTFRDSGMKPSAGRGFALVTNDACNDDWSSEFGAEFTSGPASGPNPDLLSSTFPESGFVQELDIYLDPEYPSGVSKTIFNSEGDYSPAGDEDVVFTYANSVCQSCELGPAFQPLYFGISVVKDSDHLLVDDYEVKKKGWYTFRQVFGSDVDGSLTVRFQLLKKGMPLHTKAIGTTLLSGIQTNSLETESLGNGYIWFVSIADGLQLPIDENSMRPGK